MRRQYLAHYVWVAAALGTMLGMMLLAGCGGGGITLGGAHGYVYEPIGGGTAIISASPTPPAGYQPVPAGTVVRIEGFPDLNTVTSATGEYLILGIPPGAQTLVVEAPGGDIRISIPIIAGQITEGTGHSQGGG